MRFTNSALFRHFDGLAHRRCLFLLLMKRRRRKSKILWGDKTVIRFYLNAILYVLISIGGMSMSLSIFIS